MTPSLSASCSKNLWHPPFQPAVLRHPTPLHISCESVFLTEHFCTLYSMCSMSVLSDVSSHLLWEAIYKSEKLSTCRTVKKNYVYLFIIKKLSKHWLPIRDLSCRKVTFLNDILKFNVSMGLSFCGMLHFHRLKPEIYVIFMAEGIPNWPYLYS
jgi:hypothetical protein